MDLPKEFKNYLQVQGSSPITVKNYLSDLNHFLGWMYLSLKSQNLPFSIDDPSTITRYFNENIVKQYASYLGTNSIPVATINRRYSALRLFGKFCLSQGWVRENPMRVISNQESVIRNSKNQTTTQREHILADFKKTLEKQKTSYNTIKNYLSDIRKFLSWLENDSRGLETDSR